MTDNKYIIDKLMNHILAELTELNKSKTIPIGEKLPQYQVLLDMFRVLKNYDDIQPIIADYYNKKALKSIWKDEERS